MNTPGRKNTIPENLMAADFFLEILASTAMAEFGHRLTSLLRELTGARLVFLITYDVEGNHRIIDINPARKANDFQAEQLELFCADTILPARGCMVTAMEPREMGIYQTLEKILENGRAISREFPYRVDESHQGWAIDTSAPLTDENGRITGIIGVVRDITEQKAAEKALQQFNEELLQRISELNRFNEAATGRELRMIELKKEINVLCEKAGLPPRYRTDFDETKSAPTGLTTVSPETPESQDNR